MDIILVPGLWLDASSWDPVLPALRDAGHTPRPLTMPGVGGSAAATADIGIQDWVDAVVAEIDSTAGKVVLAGHSGGGNVVWAAAEARADRVARVIFVDTVPPPDGREISEFDVVDGVVPFPGWDTFDEPDVADIDPSMRAAWTPRTQSVPARVPTDAIRLTGSARHAVPVTILSGAMDDAEFRESIAQWGAWSDEFDAITDAEVVHLRSGHWPQISKPDELAQALVDAIR
ncbi:MAG: alpha/beta hydrolase [Microbacterium sp.]